MAKKARILGAVAAGLAACAMVLGCAPQKPSPAAGSAITVWHWMTDRQAAFEKLASRYEAATGIRIDFELYAPSEAYSRKVRTAAQGSSLPDIFGILGEKRDVAAFIKAGHIYNLSASMVEAGGAWQKSFFPRALAFYDFPAGNTYGVEAGIYGVPLDIMAIQMVYNKDLMRQLGLDPGRPPQTFEDLLAVGQKAQAARMPGMVSGWAEVWLVNCFAYTYAFNIMGQDKVLATLRGEVPYTDPDWVRVLRLFQELRDSGVLASGIVSMVNKTAEQLFANGKAVLAFNGSWCVNVYKGMNPGLAYGVMLPPRASDQYPVRIWAGAGSSFMVNARSAHRQEAVRFLRWLTAQDQQRYLVAETMSLPSNRECLADVPAALIPFANDLERATHSYLWDVSEYPQVIEALGKGIQSIIIGEKTPEQVALEVQKVKIRQAAQRKP